MAPKTWLATFAALVLGMPACVCAPGSVQCEEACVDVAFDEANCGGCAVRCASGDLCLEGECFTERPAELACSSDEQCDDANPCNGEERCVAERCRLGVPINCSDGIECTFESCEPSVGCVSVALDSNCPQGSTCTALQAPGTGCEP